MGDKFTGFKIQEARSTLCQTGYKVAVMETGWCWQRGRPADHRTGPGQPGNPPTDGGQRCKAVQCRQDSLFNKRC